MHRPVPLIVLIFKYVSTRSWRDTQQIIYTVQQISIYAQCTVRAPYKHCISTAQALYIYRIYTVQAPYCRVHFGAYVIFLNGFFFLKTLSYASIFENSFLCCSFFKYFELFFTYKYRNLLSLMCSFFFKSNTTTCT